MKYILLCSVFLFILSACQAPQEAQSSANPNDQSENANTSIQELTQEEALEIAYKRANTKSTDVTALHVKRDTEHGLSVYEIEFIAKQIEYSYEISVTDGAIIKESSEVQKHSQPNANDDTNTSITLEQAQQLVLDKVPNASMQNLKIHSDYEDGIPTYEGDLIHEGMEYEFEINANTGSFIKWKEEVWD